MNLSEVKNKLKALETLQFELPNGDFVAGHFHVTEVGKITKNFIDCGGTVRNESVVNFQLWEANDYDHRLHPNKLLSIIELSEQVLEIGDYPVEVEYQGETIQKFGLEFNGTHFMLTSTQTDCLAKDKCGVPEEKPKIKLADLSASYATCTPRGGCC